MAYQGATFLGQLWAPVCCKHLSASPRDFNSSICPYLVFIVAGFLSFPTILMADTLNFHLHLFRELSLLVQHNCASSDKKTTHSTSSFVKIIAPLHSNGMTFMDNVADFSAGSRSILLAWRN